MKKIILGFAALSLLAVAGTSCDKESVVTNGGDNVLDFKVATGKQTAGTRASEETLISLQDLGSADPITVWSYRDGNTVNLYGEFGIYYNTTNTEWTYGTPVFHPSVGLTHYSVYPEVTLDPTNDGTRTTATFEYTVADNHVYQKDLMVASAHTTGDIAENAKAKLTYSHLLSQVNFAIVGKQYLHARVYGIRIEGVANHNTYDFATNSWGVPDGDADYDYVAAGGDTTPGTVDGEILYLGNTGKGGDVVSAKNDNVNALMLMPQTFTDNTKGFYFDYALTNMDDTEIYSDTNVYVDFSTLTTTTWQAGYRYLYKLVFDPVLLRFDVEVVTEWADDTTTVIDEDGEEILP